MIIWLQEFGMQILIWMLGLLDSIFAVFGAVSGIAKVNSDKGNISLSIYFMGLKDVQKAFWIVVIGAVGICLICTIAAIVKSIVNIKGGEPKSHVKTIGQSLGSIFVTLSIATVLIAAVGATDIVLSAFNTALNNGKSGPLSHDIINISVHQGYLYDNKNIQGLNEFDEDGNPTYVAYLYNYAVENGKPKRFPDTDLIIYLKPDGIEFERSSDIYRKKTDIYGNEIKDENGNPLYVLLDLGLLTPTVSESGWNNGYDKSKLAESIWNESPRTLLGTYSTGFILPYAWKNDGKINPNNFNFLIAFLCTIVLLVAVIGATLGLVKRLFDLVLLFIALPGVCATIPLDDGAKFKIWRETVISKILLAFGSVFAINVFTIVAPTLWSVNLFGASNFTNAILKMILICGGALTISGGQLLFARLVGGSAEESREMAQSARTLAASAATGAGLAKGAGRLAFGTKSANGQRIGGLAKSAGGIAGALGGGTINGLGTVLGGQAYRGSRIAGGVSATQRALKGFSHGAGWVGEGTAGGAIGGAVGGAVNKLGRAIGGFHGGGAESSSGGVTGTLSNPSTSRDEGGSAANGGRYANGILGMFGKAAHNRSATSRAAGAEIKAEKLRAKRDGEIGQWVNAEGNSPNFKKRINKINNSIGKQTTRVKHFRSKIKPPAPRRNKK